VLPCYLLPPGDDQVSAGPRGEVADDACLDVDFLFLNTHVLIPTKKTTYPSLKLAARERRADAPAQPDSSI